MSDYDVKRSLSLLQRACSFPLSLGLTFLEVRVDIVSQSNRADGGNVRPFPEVEDVQGSYSSISALEELDGRPTSQRYCEDGQVEYQVGLHLLAERSKLLLFWQNDHTHYTLKTFLLHHASLSHHCRSACHRSFLSYPYFSRPPHPSLYHFSNPERPQDIHFSP